jgi:hypothetical protein
MTDSAEGWFFTIDGRKCHYKPITDYRALCGKAAYWGKAEYLQPDSGRSPDDCAECRRRLDRRSAASAAGTEP